MEWKPIETAPKDGSEILLCRQTNVDGMPVVHFGVFCQVAAWWEGEESWVVYCNLVAEPSLHFEPSHWMPLPPPHHRTCQNDPSQRQ